MAQAIGGATVLIVGANTMDWWGRFAFLANITILVGAAAGVVVALRFVTPGGRNPVLRAWSLVAVVCRRQPTGYQGGKALKVSSPHRVKHRLNVCLTPASELHQGVVAPPVVLTPQEGEPVSAPAHTVVEGLLAQVRSSSQQEEVPAR